MVDLETIRGAPKVLLHDHLDGGLRPATVIELAEAAATATCPPTTPRPWGVGSARARTASRLELYLEGFRHTVGVMQTPDAIARVAAECAEDLAADGVVYAEVRYAPELSTQGGLSLDAVMEAWLDGFARGAPRCGRGRPTHRHPGHRDGHAPVRALGGDRGALRALPGRRASSASTSPGRRRASRRAAHLDAFQLIHRANFHVTIHAGEAFGLPSIWEALQWCGAERLGHGVRIVDDITVEPDGSIAMGRLAQYVRDRARAPRDVSDVQRPHGRRGLASRDHPIDLLRRLRFRVTVNTDNRLMSGVTLSSEMARARPRRSASVSTSCSG